MSRGTHKAVTKGGTHNSVTDSPVAESWAGTVVVLTTSLLRPVKQT
jgi:hypothetical protein